MHGGPTPQDLEELAQRLEALLTRVNARFLQVARIDPEGVVQVFVETQAKLLQFDEAAQQRFHEAVEAARVKTLARNSFLMSCLLTSAIALKQFKSEPKRVSQRGIFGKIAGVLKSRSTGATALWSFTLASFYAVVGSAAYKRVAEMREQKDAVVKERKRPS